MKLTINPTLDLITMQWLPRPSYHYFGPVMLFEGTSGAAKENEEEQTAFYKQMMQEQETSFSGSQAILSQLRGIWGPIMQAGPGQLGFTPQENAALRTEITDTGAAATANSTNATALSLKQEGGGANVLPTGAGTALTEESQVLGNQATAENLNAETAADYAQGRANFNNAATVLSGTAGLENPVGFAGAADQSGSNATSAINLADTEGSSLLNTVVGGIAGGISNIPKVFAG